MNDLIGPFISRRTTVYGTHAMVAASQPLAVNAGLEILKKGGNAADAAVAVAAALNVTEPGSTGIGGDCFCLYYDAKERTVKGLNGSGRAPKALTIDYIRNERGITADEIPPSDINSATVPGAAEGWVDTLAWFGSGRVTMEDVLGPAIRLAEEGFPVSDFSAFAWKLSEQLLKNSSDNHHEMLLNGHAPAAGEIMRNPTLAKTFRTLVREGRNGFYTGYVADAIVDLVRSKGGVLTHEDLASHHSERVDPISIDYANVTLWECPPNGQGLTALMALGIIKALQKRSVIKPLEEIEVNSADWIHILVEALKIAFADTRYYVADPREVYVPVKELLSEEYLLERSKLFNPARAVVDPVKGSPIKSSDTVYFSVVDENGNACSFIISNYMGFGTGAIPKGCGFTLQNRGSGFSLDPTTPNHLAGGKRPYHTIIPAMVTERAEDGSHDLWACYGVMGGFMQPQGHVQVLLSLLHHGLSPQVSLDIPRFCISPPGDAHIFAGINRLVVNIEDGVDLNVIEQLKRMGHEIVIVKGWKRALFGRGQVIRERRDKGGRVLMGGSDGRADGLAIGW